MKNESAIESEFLREEKRVEARIGEFKEERGLSDPVLTHILFIVCLPWIGVAAKQGNSHVVCSSRRCEIAIKSGDGEQLGELAKRIKRIGASL